VPRNEKRRQQALQRQAAKRKQKQQALRRQQQGAPSSPRGIVRRAAHWPVYECLITRDWQQTEQITQAIVARRSPNGEIAAGVFLIDLACLGVKNAFASAFETLAEYDELRQGTQSTQKMVRADLNLVAKVIREALAYARRLGFSPHPDYYMAAPLLEGADPDAVDTPVPLGKDGKPFFVAGPHDNVPRIMAQLAKAVGPGNFDVVAPIDLSPDLLEEDEDWEDEDDNGEEDAEEEEEEGGEGEEPQTGDVQRSPIWARLLPFKR
jgi:hypothetical protein